MQKYSKLNCGTESYRGELGDDPGSIQGAGDCCGAVAFLTNATECKGAVKCGLALYGSNLSWPAMTYT